MVSHIEQTWARQERTILFSQEKLKVCNMNQLSAALKLIIVIAFGLLVAYTFEKMDAVRRMGSRFSDAFHRFPKADSSLAEGSVAHQSAVQPLRRSVIRNRQ